MEEAWVHPHMACQEHSTSSKKAWQEALGRGCLSKSLGNKDLYYSHIKALSSKKHLCKDPEDKNSIPQTVESKDEAAEEAEDDYENIHLPDAQSPVLKEDLNYPPIHGDDSELVFFTIHDFLSYLNSPKWSPTLRLRVVGGPLLKTLRAALVQLEKRYLVNLHSNHTYANNRIQRSFVPELPTQQPIVPTEFESKERDQPVETKHQGKGKMRQKQKHAPEFEIDSEMKTREIDVQADQATLNQQKDESKTSSDTRPYPKPYQTDPEWIYEKLGLEIIYYEKCDKSNVPYVIQDYRRLDYYEDLPPPKPLLRQPVRKPLSEKLHKIDVAILPSYENRNETLQFAQANVNGEIPEAAMSKDTKGVESTELVLKVPEVEDIASDPYLELTSQEHLKAPLSDKAATKKQSLSDQHQMRGGTGRGKRVREKDEVVSGSSSKSVSSRASVTAAESLPVSNSHSSRTSEVSEFPTLMNVSGSESGSFDSLSCTPENDDMEENTDLELQKLNLTGTELYISSLYAPRKENERPVKEKLKLPLIARKCFRNRLAAQVFEAAVHRSNVDLFSRFKHLAKLKENEQRRVNDSKFRKDHGLKNMVAPQSSSTAATQLHDKPSQPIAQSMAPQNDQNLPHPESLFNTRINSKPTAQLWESYRKDQDISEMDSALYNELERGILERMPTIDFHPDYKKDAVVIVKDKVKARLDKNRSRNPRYNKNENWGDSELTAFPLCKTRCLTYPSYDLQASFHGDRVNITQPILRDAVVQSSFCVKPNGKLLIGEKRPPVRRIGFGASEVLIQYLAHVCHSLKDQISVSSWRPAKPGVQPTKSTDSNARSRDHSNKRPPTSALKSVKLVSDLRRDKNNSSLSYKNNSSLSFPSHKKPTPRNKESMLQSDLRFFTDNHNVLGQYSQRDNNRSAVDISDSLGEIAESITEEPTVDEGEEKMSDAEDHGEDEQEDYEVEARQSVAKTLSEILEQDLDCYRTVCLCEECVSQSHYLADLKPSNQVLTKAMGCPLILGKLKKDYRFLTGAARGEASRLNLDECGRVKLPVRHRILEYKEVGNQLLDIMSNVMIRKEILASSRGFTFITLTFTKCMSTAPDSRIKNQVKLYEQCD